MAATDDRLNNDVVIRDSYNTKNGTAHVGGIIGVDYTEGTTLLERVWNEADIPVTTLDSGGIIGYAWNCGSITMNQVYNFGKIDGDGWDDIGGFIGNDQVNSHAGITFNQCVNYGDVCSSESDEIGGFIGTASSDGKENYINFNDCANFGTISGDEYLGGFIGELYDPNDQKITFTRSYNYGHVASEDPESGYESVGFIGYIYWAGEGPVYPTISFIDSGTIGDKVLGLLENAQGTVAKEFDAQTGLTNIPNPLVHANEQFLNWEGKTTLDMQGKTGTETGSYPDGGYVWKMYETDKKDDLGRTMYYKPQLTAFQTKVQTVKHSADSVSPDVSRALYDVTMPDGQKIKGVAWDRVLALQDQFTRVNNRGDGSRNPAYSASDSEPGGSMPNHLYGFYNSSQQGLNVFIHPETIKPANPLSPEEPIKPVLPNREISRNDYLYSDDHSTGDGELHWYMHMPPLIYIKDRGIQTEERK